MNLKRFALILTLALTLFGCSATTQYDHAMKFHTDGRGKSPIALIPVFDSSCTNIGWDLSEEFTSQLRTKLQKKGHLYINTPHEINPILSTLHSEQTPFGTDVDWIKEAFSSYEYAIFTELVEHDIHSKPVKGSLVDKITPSSELSLTMRVRVFDLRGKQPEVILQEFVHQDHLIPTPSNLQDRNPGRWRKMTFTLSPMGIAHNQFSKEVSHRIEDYILLSKSTYVGAYIAIILFCVEDSRRWFYFSLNNFE